MRRKLGVTLAVFAILVLPQFGMTTFGPLHLPGNRPVGPISLPGGIPITLAHGPGGGNPDNNGDFHSGPDDGNGTHSGEKGNGGRGDCHCNDTNGNDKSTEGTSPK